MRKLSKFQRDLLERVLASALFAGFAVLSTSEGDRVFDPNVWRVALAAAIGAALSAVKGILAKRVGDPDSAALLSDPKPEPVEG